MLSSELKNKIKVTEPETVEESINNITKDRNDQPLDESTPFPEQAVENDKVETDDKQVQSDNQSSLRLGDVIELNAPTNTELHLGIFYIDYIDETRIHLIHTKNDIDYELTLKDGFLDEESIREISIIDRAEEQGFVRQNNLEKDMWINLHFKGSLPVILTGQIKDIENDMIEVELYPKKDTIYIDFAYKGIPRELNLQYIEIRNDPTSSVKDTVNIDKEEADNVNVKEDDNEEQNDKDKDEDEDNDDAKDNNIKDENVPKLLDPSSLDRDFDKEDDDEEADDRYSNDNNNDNDYEEYDLVIDGDIEKVVDRVEVSDDLKKFHIDVQKEHLLNDILSHVSTTSRNVFLLREVDRIVSRYQELYEAYSKVESDGMINETKKIGENGNSMKAYIFNVFSQPSNSNNEYADVKKNILPLDWIVFVTQNVKRIFEVPEYEDDLSMFDNNDVNIVNFESYMAELESKIHKYKTNGEANNTNSAGILKTFLKEITELWTVYNDTATPQNELSRIIPLHFSGSRLETVTDNGIDINNNLMSSTFSNKKGSIIQKLYNGRSVYVDTDNLSLHSLVTHPYENIHNMTFTKHPFNLMVQSSLNNNRDKTIYKNIQSNGEKINTSGNRRLQSRTPQNIIQTNDETQTPSNNDDIPDYIASSNFIQKEGLRETVLSPDIIDNRDITSLDKINILLDTTIPKVSSLMKKVGKYIPKYGYSSFYYITSYLKMFGGEWNTVHNNEFIEYIEMVQKYKNDYHTSVLDNTNKARSLHSVFNKKPTGLNTIAKLLKETPHEDIIKVYGLEGKLMNSDGTEILQKCVEIDNAALLYSTISKLDIDLFTDINVKQILGNKMKILEETVQKGGADNGTENENKTEEDGSTDEIKNTKKAKNTKCKQLSLSKMYLAIDEMEQDNNTENIFFDKQYDDTRYELKDEFKNESETMTSLEYKQFLVNHLIQFVGLSKDNAEIEAEALMEGRKRVRNGDYAVVKMDEGEDRYYVREGTTWTEDPEISGANESLLFCNSKKDCISVNDEVCENIDDVQHKLETNATSNIIQSLIDQENQEISDVKTSINEQYKEQLEFVKREIRRKTQEKGKYDQFKYELSLKLNEQISKHIISKSPHEKLRETIINTPSHTHKMEMLDLFIRKATRSYKREDDEDDKWLYCNITGIKLLPSFFIRLVRAYRRGETDYIIELKKICKDQGYISENNDKWIDKHTNYIITDIEFTNQDNEFASVKTDVNQEDIRNTFLSEIIIENPEEEVLKKDTTTSTSTSTIKESPDIVNIRNVVRLMNSLTGMDMTEQLPFIIRHVMRILSISIGTREEYRRRMERLAEKKAANNKTNKPPKQLTEAELTKKYRSDNHKYTLILTGLCFLFAVQTSVPEKKTKISYQNCKRSYIGYPFNKDDGDAGLTYIFCIMKRTAKTSGTNKMELWSSISKVKLENMVRDAKIVGNKLFMTDEEVKYRINQRIEYDETKEEIIPIDKQILWSQFLPRLNVHDMNLNKVNPIGKTFEKRLMDILGNSSRDQHEQLNILHGKLDAYALQIQYYVQGVMKKEEIYLQAQGEPYLENICCLTNVSEEIDTNRFGSLQYFMRHQSKLIEVINHIYGIQRLLGSVKKMDTLTYALESNSFNSSLSKDSEGNIVTKHTNRKIAFTKELIYSIFIHVCKGVSHNNELTPEMKTICEEINRIDKRYREDALDDERQKDKLEEMMEYIEKNGRRIDEIQIMKMVSNIYNQKTKQRDDTKMLNNACIGHMGLNQYHHWVEHLTTMLLDNERQSENNELLENSNNMTDDNLDIDREDEYIFSTIFREKMDNYIHHKSNAKEDIINWLMIKNREWTDSLSEFMSQYLVNRTNRESNKVNKFIEEGLIMKPFTSMFTNLDTMEYTSVHNVRSLKHYIYNFAKVFSMMIQKNQVVSHKVHTHWNLSSNHNQHIEGILRYKLDAWLSMIKRPILSEMYTILNPLYHNVYKVSKILPNLLRVVECNKGMEIQETEVKDSEISTQLHKYLLLGMINKMIDQASMVEQDDVVTSKTEDDDFEMLEQRTKLNTIADYIFLCMEYFQDDFDMAKMTENDIKEQIIRQRDDEKNRIIRRLDNMTKDERRVDNLLKRARLGEWDVGSQMGLRIYDKDFYDREHENREREEALDRKAKQVSYLTDSTRNLYRMDLEEEAMREAEIEEEENNLDQVPDDDDYGSDDGDM